MVTRVRVVPAEVTAESWLYAADDDVLLCRGQNHEFPKIRKTRTGVIKGIRTEPVNTAERQGVTRIFATCSLCGTVRIEDTLPGGLLQAPHRYSYIYPPKYKPPKGVKVTRSASFNETWRRVTESGGLALSA